MSKQFAMALITGASSGLGEALCRLLAAKGIALLITGRNSSKLEQLALELQKQVKVIHFSADLAILSDRSKVIDILREYSPDLVINNAGFGLYGDILSYPTTAQLDILNVNGNAVLEISIEAARVMMVQKKQGFIVNISSAAAFQIFPQMAVYAAAKAFVNSFSEAFDMEMERYGIRILTACPGMIDTAFSVRAGGATSHTMNDNLKMSTEFAAEEIWWQIQKAKPLHIFDWKYRLGTYLGFFIPKKWRAKILRKRITKRLP